MLMSTSSPTQLHSCLSALRRHFFPHSIQVLFCGGEIFTPSKVPDQVAMTTPGVVRFGVIGCANIARKLCRAIHLAPNATLVAVASRSLSKAEDFKSSNNLADSVTVYGDYESVLNDPCVDAVYVPLPTSLHLKWSVAAAEKKKHILLEKPTALCVEELDVILDACAANGVQFMDGTMWMHHPRTEKMKEVISDASGFGELKMVHSTFTFSVDSDFLENDIRVKSNLDPLGCLGDIGWYSVRSILWAYNYSSPKTVIANPNPVFNESGVLLSCGASITWEDGKQGTFHCSFLAHFTMTLGITGTKGTLHLNDFAVPFEERSAFFTLATDSGLTEQATSWQSVPNKHVVNTEDLPQEARMIAEFSKLVMNIKDNAGNPEKEWPAITRKTQLVLDAVTASIRNDFTPIHISGWDK